MKSNDANQETLSDGNPTESNGRKRLLSALDKSAESQYNILVNVSGEDESHPSPSREQCAARSEAVSITDYHCPLCNANLHHSMLSYCAHRTIHGPHAEGDTPSVVDLIQADLTEAQRERDDWRLSAYLLMAICTLLLIVLFLAWRRG